MKNRLALSALLTALLLPGVVHAAEAGAAPKCHVLILATTQPLGSVPEYSIWLSHFLERYRANKNRVECEPKAHVLQPSFDEEFAATLVSQGYYDQFRAKGALGKSSRFEVINEIKRAGYLREFVWEYVKPGVAQAEPAGLRMAEYQDWKQSRNLTMPGPQPLSLGIRERREDDGTGDVSVTLYTKEISGTE